MGNMTGNIVLGSYLAIKSVQMVLCWVEKGDPTLCVIINTVPQWNSNQQSLEGGKGAKM